MDHDTNNAGSFAVIAAIGKGKAKPVEAPPEKKEISDANEEELARLQQWYLWNCTFTEI